MKPRIVQHWVRAERRANTTIACTGLDALLQKVPAGLIFLFEERLDHAALLAALPGVLERYPLCAGRLRTTRSGLQIVCNDAGIPASIVELDQTCESALQGYAGPVGWDLVEPIRLLGAATGRAPLFTLRISHFRDHGSCLGIGWHHSLGDMQTFKAVMQALAAAASGRPIDPPLIVEERGAYLARHVPDNHHVRSTLRCLSLRQLPGLARVLVVDNRRTQQKAFYFSSREALALRAALQEQAGRPLTVNDAVCAHMFELIANVDPRQRPRQLTVAVNWRRRLGLPVELLGNLVSGMSITCEPGRTAASIAVEMRARLERFIEDELDYSSNERFIYKSGGALGVHRMLPPGIDPAQGSMLVSSWKGFGLFDLDFAGARPFTFGLVGRAAVPWAGGVVEGFHNEGLIFGCYLPRDIVSRLSSEPMRSVLHRHQPKDEPRPAFIERLPWVA